MRIITGDYKGRKLETPRNNDIRPTPEKAKEAIFSMLMDRLDGAVCCDLFAGTGALGLEALSRGADFCYFGDHAQESIDMVRRNVAHCRAEEYSRIIHGSFVKTLSVIDRPVDIFFLDPPYKKTLLEDSMAMIAEKGLLAEDGVIVAEHGKDKTLPDELSGFTKVKEKRYGIVVISMFM